EPVGLGILDELLLIPGHLGGRHRTDQPVAADAETTVAQGLHLRGGDFKGSCGIRQQDEVVSSCMALGKWLACKLLKFAAVHPCSSCLVLHSLAAIVRWLSSTSATACSSSPGLVGSSQA